MLGFIIKVLFYTMTDLNVIPSLYTPCLIILKIENDCIYLGRLARRLSEMMQGHDACDLSAMTTTNRICIILHCVLNLVLKSTTT